MTEIAFTVVVGLFTVFSVIVLFLFGFSKNKKDGNDNNKAV